MLESALKEQLKGIFAGLEAEYTLDIAVAIQHEVRQELLSLLGDVAECSDKISCQVNQGDALEFTVLKNGRASGIHFRGVPNGHEFTSLLLAILNSDGKGKNLPDECHRREPSKDHRLPPKSTVPYGPFLQVISFLGLLRYFSLLFKTACLFSWLISE